MFGQLLTRSLLLLSFVTSSVYDSLLEGREMMSSTQRQILCCILRGSE